MADIRHADFVQDAEVITALDTGFVTKAVYDVAVRGDAIVLNARILDAPLSKRFPLDDLQDPDRPYDVGWVAADEGRIVGFAAASFQAWNRRLVLWHLYVDTPARGLGLARRLVEAAQSHGVSLGARHVWLETSSLNAPGIAAYEAMGFSLTGADLTLYDGTPAEGETALFFSRPI
jgi:ribosomal protein S18 acetylase RimI-like enzyme